MRSNFFKYIFIIFIFAVVIYSIYAIYFKDKDVEEDQVVVIETEEEEIKKYLRFGISNFDNINPLISNNKEILNIDRLIFEPLINITSDYRVEYCLATELSKISETSYVVKIDNEKKWHNGTPLIAKDIQFTIDRLKEGRSVYSYNVEKVNGIEILDSSTVKINLSEPVPFFEYNLTFPILPNNYYIGEDFYTTKKTPIGTGMYKIASMDDQNIILGKNDKWWNISNQNARVEVITIRKFSEIGEVYNSFKLGNIDIFTTSNYNLENYIGTIGYIKQEFSGRELDYLALNCNNNVLKNVEVRKAIAFALDKNNLVSSVYGNNRKVSNFPLDYGNYLYEDKESSITYNQDQAKRILQDAGWEYKYNRWQKRIDNVTRRISLTLTVNREDANRVKVAENIKAQLEKIGMKISINKVSSNTYKNILSSKNYEMIITGVYNSYSPSVETFFADNNLQNYNNEELKNILREVKNIGDANLLKEKYDRIIEIYNNDIPFVCLYRNKTTVVKNTDLVGDLKPNNYFSYYNLYMWARR